MDDINFFSNIFLVKRQLNLLNWCTKYIFKLHCSIGLWKITFGNFYKLINLITIFKNSSFFRINVFFDLTLCDYLTYYNSFLYVFVLKSLYLNNIFLFKNLFNDYTLDYGSKEHLFNSVSWLEREIFDMFGLLILNHKDLRRILTDYGFQGYPLRKDFPKTGYIEMFYQQNLKSLVIRPLELAQIKQYIL